MQSVFEALVNKDFEQLKAAQQKLQSAGHLSYEESAMD